MTSIAEETPIYADIIVRRNYITRLFWDDYDHLANIFEPTLDPKWGEAYNRLYEQHERREYDRLHAKLSGDSG